MSRPYATHCGDKRRDTYILIGCWVPVVMEEKVGNTPFKVECKVALNKLQPEKERVTSTRLATHCLS